MAHDLLIRNGLVVDGTGSEPTHADVAIGDGRIVAIGRGIGGARRTIDADGHVVAPGFIDGHTHLDAQLMWDPTLSPSCLHGVTTVVMGNCGFTLAPVRDDAHHLVVRNLERAEDMSPAALAAGIDWSWQTFPEYLDVIAAVPKALNVAAYVGHSALRTWAMGERAFETAATDDDVAAMLIELRAAVEAGAVGLSTSRSDNHETSDDRPVASRLAAWSEVTALVGALGEYPRTTFELAPEPATRADDPERRAEWDERLQHLIVQSGVGCTFGVPAVRADGADWRGQLALVQRVRAAGGRMWGQSHSRGISTLVSFLTRLPFDPLPVWRDVRALPLPDQEQVLRDPDVRRRLVESTSTNAYGRTVGAEAGRPDFERLFVLERPVPPHRSVADVARDRHCDPVEAMIDLALEASLDRFFMQALTLHDDETVGAILRDPGTVMTFSDSGAHVSQIVDCSIHSHLLAYWVREKEAFTLAQAVRMVTHDVASAWGFTDRGVVRTGAAADICIFDPATVAPSMPTVRHDLPAGAVRLHQGSTGIAATVVAGEIVVDDGVCTGAVPGRLLRRS